MTYITHFSTLRPYWSSTSSTLIHSPDSTTERSPSLLPHVKRFSEDCSINKAKRKKEESEPEVQEDNKEGILGLLENQKEGKRIQTELSKRTSAPLNDQSFKKQPLDSKVTEKGRTSINACLCENLHVRKQNDLQHFFSCLWIVWIGKTNLSLRV